MSTEPDADENLKVEFYYNLTNVGDRLDDDQGTTPQKEYTDDYYGEVPGFDDEKIQLREDGWIILKSYPWRCENGGNCDGRARFVLFPSGEDDNLRGGDNVYIKDTSTANKESFLVSWENVQYNDGTGLVNIQVEMSDDGAVHLCFGEGSLGDSSRTLDLVLTVFLDPDDPSKTNNFRLPEGFDNSKWPGSICFCLEEGDAAFSEIPGDRCELEAQLGYPELNGNARNGE